MENIIPDGFKGERAIVTPYNIRTYQKENYITKQMYITHIGYYPDAKFHLRKRDKGAKENIFIYCEKGSGWIEYNNERFQLKENSFFVIPANEPHTYGADKRNPWSIYWLHFQGDNVEMFKSIMGKLIHIEHSERSRIQDRIQLFNEIYQNLSMGYSPENLEYTSFCLMHFLASLKYIYQYREIKKLKEDDIIQKSILFMKDNLENKILVEDIANTIGYSPSHFNTLFVQRTSFSPIEYYNQLKIQRACTYLQFSELKIKEIAFRLNYYDPFHFSKAFHKEMGITPKNYREKYQDKAFEV
ncbi:AraC family transcriptional regulator [Dysgonomonas sp. 216]|uniref:AraC family transcriptional regulator n=1 Tax=Dysgonomonas sp. 216 TaxID=2302934 RepID=UPI0013D0DB86|nr:AraC family transcriptional regulator [Dysgonomonas sp. 216]NDW18819.1 AraC family transcriptional regulator [Dysgonomonas sp. 216]